MAGKRHISHNHRPPSDEELPEIEHDILKALNASVDRVLKEAHDVQGDPGVYVGILGIVLMNTHLASLAEEAGIGAEEDFLAPNDRYLTTALHLFPSVLHKPRTPARSSFLETSVGLATLMLIHTKTNDSHKYPWQKCLQIIERASQDIVVETAVSDDDGCEVLYGRAGFLYALLRLRRSFSEDTVTEVGLAVNASNVISDGNIERVAANVIARGRYGAQEYAAQLRSDAGPRLMWSWHAKRYLGGAHGVAGILNVLLQCPSHLLNEAYDDIWDTVDWFVSIHDEDGNWPSKAPAHTAYDVNELIQWCHGAPGVLMLLSRALQHPSAARYARRVPSALRAVDRAANLVYRRGLLRKGIGACHGTAGSIFALLAAARLYAHRAVAAEDGNGKGRVEGPGGLETRARQEEKARENVARAAHLAHLVLMPEVVAKMGTSDRPHSLYEGLAGMVCAWGSVLLALRRGSEADERWGLPGLDDLY
ncbi:hypothetical protein FB107DRAFT_260695 [Schizophyllum commune]